MGMGRTTLACVFVILVAMSGVAGQADRPAVYTAEQAARGKVAMRTNVMAAGDNFGACSDCHSEGLGGRTGNAGEQPAVASLKPNLQKMIADAGGRIPDLVGPAFRARWANRSVKDLSQNFKDRFGLSEQTRLDILAYVLSENGFRAGTEPLTMATDVPIRLLSGAQAP
jgi:cytochrome c553